MIVVDNLFKSFNSKDNKKRRNKIKKLEIRQRKYVRNTYNNYYYLLVHFSPLKPHGGTAIGG